MQQETQKEIKFSINGLETENGKADLITKSLFLDIDGIGKREVKIDQYSNGAKCIKTVSLLLLEYSKIDQLLKQRANGSKTGWDEKKENELIQSIADLEKSVTGLGEAILGKAVNAELWEYYGTDAVRYTNIIYAFYNDYFAPAVRELNEEWNKSVIKNNTLEKDILESYEKALKEFDAPDTEI